MFILNIKTKKYNVINKIYKFQNRFKLAGLIFVVTFALLFSNTISDHKKSQAATLDTQAISSTDLRPIAHDAAKPVCAQPKPGQASCAEEVLVNKSGQQISGSPATIYGYGPVQFHTAYNLPCSPGGVIQSICTLPSSYGPQTVAIVDAGGFSAGGNTIESSLNVFDQYYGLPACTKANSCLTEVNQSGQTSSLPASQGWDSEIALDVDTVHSICQTCKIVLIEANSAYLSDLSASQATAVAFNPVAISNSWLASSVGSTYDSNFNHPGIAEVAATGDNSGAPIAWPAINPNVIAASGTSLNLNNDNTWASETVWSGTGGDCNSYYSAPTWQATLSNWNSIACGSYRAFGDMSADANPNTGEAIYTSAWYEYGGTSLATPIIASMIALAGGVQPGNNAVSILYSSSKSGNYHDITSGSNCSSQNSNHCTAAAGFDTPSGIGSPNGLGMFAVAPATSLTASTGNNSGTQVNLSWTASTENKLGGYYVYKNGAQVANITNATTYNATGLTVNTAYNFYVVAYDIYNNISAASNTSNIITYLPADINQDGHVDLLDLNMLASRYNSCGGNLGRADINNDGCIDLLDLGLLSQKYNTE